MVIASIGNQTWIETFHIARGNVSTGSTSSATHTLERPGVFIGGSASPDANSSQADGIYTVLSKDATTQLLIGDQISSVLTIRANDSGSTRTFGVHVVLMMRVGVGA